MFKIKNYRFTIAVCFVAGLIGCQPEEEGHVELAGQRSIVVASSRDSGLSAGGLRFIDTGTPVNIDSAEDGPEGVGETCDANTRRSCSEGCGVQFCVNGGWSNCSPGPEACNGDDDDCDGQVDEGLGIGTGCTNRQENGCLAEGRLSCEIDGTGVVCQTDPMMPSTEICDGIDNDCDGLPDEDFANMRCCRDDFQCPPGAACEAGECVETDGQNGGAPRSPQPGDPCVTLFDCGFGQFCINQQCAAACLSQEDCEADRVCGCSYQDPNCLFTTCLAPGAAAP